jgi:hypothetical protein
MRKKKKTADIEVVPSDEVIPSAAAPVVGGMSVAPLRSERGRPVSA